MKALTLLMIPAALFAGQGRRRDLPSAPFRGCWELRRKPTAESAGLTIPLDTLSFGLLPR